MLLLRDAPDHGGLEVLMTRRSGQTSLPRCLRIPRRGIEALDADPPRTARQRAAPKATNTFTQAIAAIRESFEELGVLLARYADGRMADADDIAALGATAPGRCSAGPWPAAGGRQRCAMLALDWPTATFPNVSTCRILVAHMPAGQTPVADERNSSSPSGCPHGRWSGMQPQASSCDLPDHPHAAALRPALTAQRRCLRLRRERSPPLWDQLPRAA